jgi:hypothetical protein
MLNPCPHMPPLFSFEYPEVYQVFGSIRSSTAKSFSDGAIKYITINRIAGTPVILNRDDISITKNNTEITDFNSVMKNETLQISTKKLNDNYQYSFWRIDARGYRLIRDWQSGEGSNTLSWTPAQSGNYTISIRVRDKANNNPSASYESAQSIAFDIQGYDQTVTNATITTTSNTGGTDIKRMPVTINASATATKTTDNILYRYEISDKMMGTYTIKEYTPEPQCTWYPRKAGTYTIVVRIRDEASYGYYDTYTTREITVT